MRAVLLIAILLTQTCVHFAQTKQPKKPSKKVEKYLLEVKTIISEKSLYKDSLDWAQLSVKIQRLSAGITSYQDCHRVLDTVIAQLRKIGDHHSLFIRSQQAKTLMGKVSTPEGIKCEYLGDGIAYLKIPSHFSINQAQGKSYAAAIQSGIERLDQSNDIKGWVIDLRGNQGGNVYPMLRGLGSILGDSVLGYFVSPEKEVSFSAYGGQAGLINLTEQYHVKYARCSLAIVIDKETASSGELLAIAFKSIDRAVFFGQPTAGYTTSNQTFPLPDRSLLVLSVGYFTDSKKKKYIPNVSPDVFIAPEKQDSMIWIAKKWLIEK